MTKHKPLICLKEDNPLTLPPGGLTQPYMKFFRIKKPPLKEHIFKDF